MTDESTAIETTVSAEQWEKVVGFYTRLLGAPQQQSDSEAHFASPDDGLMIRLVKEDTERALTINEVPKPKLRGGPNGFGKITAEHTRIRNSNHGNCTTLIEPITHGPQGHECTLVVVRVGGLVAHTEYAIHNPNWIDS